MEAHERLQRPLAARHGSRRHRHADGGGARAQEDGEEEPPRPGPRGVPRSASGSGRRSTATASASSTRCSAPSLDWSRERFTMDAGVSAAVREVFVRLYEEGLIYRAQKLINWCPSCHTALSDLEVEHEEKQGSLWHIHYPVKGSDRKLTVATTRPETMLGDTAVAIHPEDPRYTGLAGQKRGAAAHRPRDPHHRRRRAGGHGVRHRRGEGDAGPRLQRLPDGPAAQAADDHHPRRRRAHQQGGAASTRAWTASRRARRSSRTSRPRACWRRRSRTSCPWAAASAAPPWWSRGCPRSGS